MTYEEQLNDPKWKRKRYRILQRDAYQCQCCKKDKTDDVKLHVHHKYYLYGNYAWMYDDDALITYCDECHAEFHENNSVPIYVERDGHRINMNFTPCERCGGAGYFPEYKNVENGICFRCRGARYEELIESSNFNIQKYIDDLLETQSQKEFQQSTIKPSPKVKSTSKRVSDKTRNTLDFDIKPNQFSKVALIDFEKHNKANDYLVHPMETEAGKRYLKILEEEGNKQIERQRKQEETIKKANMRLAIYMALCLLFTLVMWAINS